MNNIAVDSLPDQLRSLCRCATTRAINCVYCRAANELEAKSLMEPPVSYIKNSIDLDTRLQRLNLTRMSELELRDRAELENLERLRWEVERAMSNLFEAINRRETRLTAEACRRIEADIAAGNPPF